MTTIDQNDINKLSDMSDPDRVKYLFERFNGKSTWLPKPNGVFLDVKDIIFDLIEWKRNSMIVKHDIMPNHGGKIIKAMMNIIRLADTLNNTCGYSYNDSGLYNDFIRPIGHSSHNFSPTVDSNHRNKVILVEAGHIKQQCVNLASARTQPKGLQYYNNIPGVAQLTKNEFNCKTRGLECFITAASYNLYNFSLQESSCSSSDSTITLYTELIVDIPPSLVNDIILYVFNTLLQKIMGNGTMKINTVPLYIKTHIATSLEDLHDLLRINNMYA